MDERVRILREVRDLTQRQLAQMLRIHQTTYSDYELGRLNVPTAVWEKLADFYGVSGVYLLGRTDREAPYPPRR